MPILSIAKLSFAEKRFLKIKAELTEAYATV